MGCITNVSFAVLINGVATSFFQIQRGMWQGCPLSPLLFLLAMEGLIQMISHARRRGEIKWIEVVVNLFITHLLFVDNIILFSSGSHEEIWQIKDILDLFLKATSLCINIQKNFGYF